MKVIAYHCEVCKGVFKDKEAVGLIVNQPTLLDDYIPYQITNSVEKCTYHFCMNCHRKHVTDLIKGIDRSKDEQEYSYYYNLYSKRFYANVHREALLRNNSNDRKHSKLL